MKLPNTEFPIMTPMDDGDFVRALPDGVSICNLVISHNKEWQLASYFCEVTPKKVIIEPFTDGSPEWYEIHDPVYMLPGSPIVNTDDEINKL